jgi:hypothetical protein
MKKIKIYNDMKNVFNYTTKQYDFIIGFYKNIIPASLTIKNDDIFSGASEGITYLDDDSKNEIFFEYNGNVNKLITKIYVKQECIDKYKNILYTAFKYLGSDSDILINCYKFIPSYSKEPFVYIMFDVYIWYSDLFNSSLPKYSENMNGNKIIRSYTVDDVAKLFNECCKIFKLFGDNETANKNFTMCLSKQFNGELKYFKYNNTTYAIDYDDFKKYVEE